MTIQDSMGRPFSSFISNPDSRAFLTALSLTTSSLDCWIRIRDSEDELQEFLGKCFDYGNKYKSIETKTLSTLEEE